MPINNPGPWNQAPEFENGDLFSVQTANQQIYNQTLNCCFSTDPSILPLGGLTDPNVSTNYRTFSVLDITSGVATIEDASLPDAGKSFLSNIQDPFATFENPAAANGHFIWVIDQVKDIWTRFPIVEVLSETQCKVDVPDGILQVGESYRYRDTYNVDQAITYGHTHDGINSVVAAGMSRPIEDNAQAVSVEVFTRDFTDGDSGAIQTIDLKPYIGASPWLAMAQVNIKVSAFSGTIYSVALITEYAPSSPEARWNAYMSQNGYDMSSLAVYYFQRNQPIDKADGNLYLQCNMISTGGQCTVTVYLEGFST